MIPIDLSKQQTLDADLKAIQKVNFTGNLEQWFSSFKKQKEKLFQTFQKELWKYSNFNFLL